MSVHCENAIFFHVKVEETAVITTVLLLVKHFRICSRFSNQLQITVLMTRLPFCLKADLFYLLISAAMQSFFRLARLFFFFFAFF